MKNECEKYSDNDLWRYGHPYNLNIHNRAEIIINDEKQVLYDNKVCT